MFLVVMSSPSAADSTCIVQVDGLTKRYGTFTALSDCSIDVHRGEVFGLLGPNGAGKSTLIRLIMGFLQPTAGTARVEGFDSQNEAVELRRRVAYLPGDARLPRHLSGDGVLKFFAEIHPAGDLERSRQLADLLELDRRRRVGFMSTGMRQKLALAVVLGLQTPLLILDEPTANLDPSIRSRVLDLVLEARRSGRTVILSSHVMSEIEDTCDRVMFLRHGCLVRELAMAELFQRHRVIARTARTNDIEVPSQWRDRVAVHPNSDHLTGDHPPSIDASTRRVTMDISGDLADVLSWLSTLDLINVRIEPVGLRTIYQEVHQDESSDRMVVNINAQQMVASEVSA